jgi:hypothetical protein
MLNLPKIYNPIILHASLKILTLHLHHPVSIYVTPEQISIPTFTLSYVPAFSPLPYPFTRVTTRSTSGSCPILSHVHTNARLGLDPGLNTMTESVLIIILLPIQYCLVHRPENTPLNKSIILLNIRPWTVDARDEFSLNTYGTYYTEFNLHVLREDTSVLVYFSLPGYHVFM